MSPATGEPAAMSPATGEPAAMSRPRSSTGAEWVSAPTDTRSAPGPGVGPDRLERDPARHLHQARRRRLAHGGHAPAHLVHGHVVEQHQVRPRLHGRHHLLEGVALHVHALARPAVAGPAHRLVDAEGGQVVVLEHHPVRQVAPVVDPAAGPHGRLLQRPQARRGLARVPDAHPPVGGVDEAPGEGGHARQVAEQVEGGALGRQQRGQRAGGHGHHGAGGQAGAVVGVPGDGQRRVDLVEHLLGGGAPGQHAAGPGHDLGVGRQALGQQRGGDVAQRLEVLGQGAAHDLGDRGARGVHGRAQRSELPSGCGRAVVTAGQPTGWPVGSRPCGVTAAGPSRPGCR